MRLCLDISSVPYGTGVSRYTANLVRALIPQLESDDQLVLFGSSLRRYQLLNQFVASLSGLSATSPALNSKIYLFPPSVTSFCFSSLPVPISIFTGRTDIFHAWDWYIPRPGKAKLVATIHDLAPFKFPKTATQSTINHHKSAINRLKKYRATVIAVSTATKNDLMEFFSYPEPDIVVIPEALPAESALAVNQSVIDAVKTRFNLQKPYFLMVGTREPRKNHAKQIAAWMHFRAQYDLVVVGKEAWGDQTKHPGVTYTGYLEGQDLAALYQGASLLLYCSLYEGFGLPILEAFFHRLPVVTSNVSSLPEVAGNAAGYADPTSSEGIVQAVNAVLQNPPDFIQRGLARLKTYSWANTARSTLALYRKLSGS